MEIDILVFVVVRDRYLAEPTPSRSQNFGTNVPGGGERSVRSHVDHCFVRKCRHVGVRKIVGGDFRRCYPTQGTDRVRDEYERQKVLHCGKAVSNSIKRGGGQRWVSS